MNRDKINLKDKSYEFLGNILIGVIAFFSGLLNLIGFSYEKQYKWTGRKLKEIKKGKK